MMVKNVVKKFTRLASERNTSLRVLGTELFPQNNEFWGRTGVLGGNEGCVVFVRTPPAFREWIFAIRHVSPNIDKTLCVAHADLGYLRCNFMEVQRDKSTR